MDKLDLQSKDIKEKLKSLLEKLTWPTFPGVQSLLLKVFVLSTIIVIYISNHRVLNP